MAPPLELNHAGVPIDDMRGFESLENADGFVLLWGKKEPSSLVAQINQVEGRIPKDRDLPPGIVAYLMPPQPDMGESVPAWGWKVLRFNAQPLDRLDVVDKEADRLDTFLRKILDRVQRRRGLPLALA